MRKSCLALPLRLLLWVLLVAGVPGRPAAENLPDDLTPATPPAREEASPDAEAESPASGLAAPEALRYEGPPGIRPGPRPEGRPLEPYTNEMVTGLVRFYLERKRDVLERGYARSGRYLEMIRRILAEEGVPPQLAYLAAVESNFNPQARSPAHAVGLWQFTAPTARLFGLRIERPWYDERRDPHASTMAAARLLGYLYDRYGEWELALAAYNAGENRVNQAIARARGAGLAVDYWRLRLPRQTRGFVPAFLAVTEIYEHPEAYGLAGLEREPPLRSEPLHLVLATTLHDIAQRLEQPVGLLQQLNPAWKGGLIPPFAEGKVLLWVPQGTAERLVASLGERPPAEIPWLTHRVREGETASQIAGRYGVGTSDLLALNGLRRTSLIHIGQPLLVPVAAGSVPAEAPAAEEGLAQGKGKVPAMAQLHFHTVKNGESLWTISRQYGVRMTALRAWNELEDSLLLPEQQLVVFLPIAGAVYR